MTESNININVKLDDEKVPQQIKWSASESSADSPQIAKAMVLALWDGTEKTALRIDLWTKNMMTDEMADFYYQIFVTMADTFQRATRQEGLAGEIKRFATDFHKKFIEKENAEK
jgi:gliding motility-associated protein GldC